MRERKFKWSLEQVLVYFLVISFLAFSAPGSASCWLPPVVMFKPARWGEGKHVHPCASLGKRGVVAKQGSCFVSASCLQKEIGFIFMAGSGGFLKVAPASSLSSGLCQKTALGGLEP